MTLEKLSRVHNRVLKLIDLESELEIKADATAKIEAAKQSTEILKLENKKQSKRDRAMSNQPKVDWGAAEGAVCEVDNFELGDGYTGR